jgi:hypothetical protein
LTRAVAEALTRALDAGDFGAAGRLLSSECECEDGALHARGAEAVLALYRAAASWAERGFDDVRHSSAIECASGAHARAVVTTYLMRVPGRWHRLRHVLDISLNPSGEIVRLVPSCEAATAAAFRTFVRECGAAPPPPGYGA